MVIIWSTGTSIPVFFGVGSWRRCCWRWVRNVDTANIDSIDIDLCVISWCSSSIFQGMSEHKWTFLSTVNKVNIVVKQKILTLTLNIVCDFKVFLILFFCSQLHFIVSKATFESKTTITFSLNTKALIPIFDQSFSKHSRTDLKDYFEHKNSFKRRWLKKYWHIKINQT